jgi:putative hydrolase of the HAD superfamily
MEKHRVLLLDADGVLVMPPKLFSEVYCEKYGVDPEKQQRFYATDDFKQALLGKLNLVDAIKAHNDLWQWRGDFSQLVEMWLEAENYPNEDLVDLINIYKKQGLPIYLATQQEEYRANYLKETMFRDLLDGIFCSCDIRANKHDKSFWQSVIKSLSNKYEDIAPNEIAYFDDRQSIVDVARACGLDAHLYTKVGDVKALIAI